MCPDTIGIQADHPDDLIAIRCGSNRIAGRSFDAHLLLPPRTHHAPTQSLVAIRYSQPPTGAASAPLLQTKPCAHANKQRRLPRGGSEELLVEVPFEELAVGPVEASGGRGWPGPLRR